MLMGGSAAALPVFIGVFVKYAQGDVAWETGVLALFAVLLISIGGWANGVAFIHSLNIQVGMRAAFHLRTALFRTSILQALSQSGAELSNLVGVDCERVFQGLWMGNWVPMQLTAIVLLLYVLARVMTVPAALVVAASMVGLVLLQGVLSGWLRIVRQQMQAASDERLGLTNMLFQSIRVMKFLAIEPAITEKISAVRSTELMHAAHMTKLRAASSSAVYVLPSVATTAAFAVLACQDDMIGLEDAMVVIGAVTMLRTPVSALPTTMSLLSEASASIQRLRNFFSRVGQPQGDADSPLAEIKVDSQPTHQGIELTQCVFSWADSDTWEHSTLKDYSEDSLAGHSMQRELHCAALVVPPGQLCCVTGSVGSGKSSLCLAVLGRMTVLTGSPRVPKCAYCSQSPWLVSGTVKHNITLGHRFDEGWYSTALRVAQLNVDLASLQGGDSCVVGEHGITLSGGQKARMALARAVYRSFYADVLVLDDVLAAVDSTVAAAIVQAMTEEPTLASKSRLVVLSSHYELAEKADSVVAMSRGQVTQYSEITQYQASKHYFKAVPGHSAQQPTEQEAPEVIEVQGEAAVLYAPEERRAGLLSRSTYASYLRAMHSGKGSAGTTAGLVVLLVLVLGTEMLRVSSDVLIACWAQDSFGWTHNQYLLCLTGLTVAMCTTAFGRAWLFMDMASQAAESIHTHMLSSVTAASVPLFFDLVPAGQLSSAFSKELDVVDTLLPFYLFEFLTEATFMLCSVLLLCVCAPLVLLLALPSEGSHTVHGLQQAAQAPGGFLACAGALAAARGVEGGAHHRCTRAGEPLCGGVRSHSSLERHKRSALVHAVAVAYLCVGLHGDVSAAGVCAVYARRDRLTNDDRVGTGIRPIVPWEVTVGHQAKHRSRELHDCCGATAGVDGTDTRAACRGCHHDSAHQLACQRSHRDSRLVCAI
eukprot:TRINITY_DN6519_c0_g1_i3.p1 TRINITY_DN6519_c0_g1~~TRINITY_DN6519_c0_g1_i3.p1  ORF type:complete len:933 (-),score=206.93 TRINITY_DN6519_c0_g1_i3:855-3653(-)